MAATNGPEWSDAAGWDDVSYYSTIQTAVVGSDLYLLGRASTGMETWKFDAGNNSWKQLAVNSWLSDNKGCGDVSKYSTIQTAVVNGDLYLLGRASTGTETIPNPGSGGL